MYYVSTKYHEALRLFLPRDESGWSDSREDKRNVRHDFNLDPLALPVPPPLKKRLILDENLDFFNVKGA